MAKLLTAREAADILDVTTERIRQFRLDGRLKPAYARGRLYLYSEADIRRFSQRDRPSGRPKSKAG